MSKITPKCGTCLHWKMPPADGDYSECLLTTPDAHEVLTYQLLYVWDDAEDLWVPLPEDDEMTAILHTRKDYGCVQYDSRN